jgi:glycosyltransferase involved in cell wall biosynthesis
LSQIKIIGIAPCYNEIEMGNLDRFLRNIPKVVDGMVLLDDCSTDGSYERMKEVTKNVIRNQTNMFLWERRNTNLLIDWAAALYPELTHILSLNIDCTFPPSCFREGEALLHKACEKLSSQADMLRIRDIQLWKSDAWHRVDGWFGERHAERIYIKGKPFRMLDEKRGLHLGKITSTNSLSITTVDGFEEVVSLHWGWDSERKILKKFHRYMSLEPKAVPNPEDYHKFNEFSLLDEWNVKVEPIKLKWLEYGPVNHVLPKPTNYHLEIAKYDSFQADNYKEYFESHDSY